MHARAQISFTFLYICLVLKLFSSYPFFSELPALLVWWNLSLSDFSKKSSTSPVHPGMNTLPCARSETSLGALPRASQPGRSWLKDGGQLSECTFECDNLLFVFMSHALKCKNSSLTSSTTCLTYCSPWIEFQRKPQPNQNRKIRSRHQIINFAIKSGREKKMHVDC